MSRNKLQPRGIRNHNPGNIELGDPWQGLSANQTDGRFAQFDNPVYGIRALARVLITYQDKRRATDGSRIDSVNEIISRWAPSFENDTSAYAKAVAAAVGVGVDDETIDVHDYHTLKALVSAIIKHENGIGNLKTDNTWYSDAVIDRALALAGVEPKHTGVVPVNKDTIGATVAGGLGATELAEIMPVIISTIEGNQEHLSSGDIVRIVMGVILLGAGIYVAVNQIKRRREGVV